MLRRTLLSLRRHKLIYLFIAVGGLVIIGLGLYIVTGPTRYYVNSRRFSFVVPGGWKVDKQNYSIHNGYELRMNSPDESNPCAGPNVNCVTNNQPNETFTVYVYDYEGSSLTNWINQSLSNASQGPALTSFYSTTFAGQPAECAIQGNYAANWAIPGLPSKLFGDNDFGLGCYVKWKDTIYNFTVYDTNPNTNDTNKIQSTIQSLRFQ
jgi:hypothetical protein